MCTDVSNQKADLRSLLNKASELSSFPHTLTSVLQASQNPRSSAADLEHAVETDPPLTARILSAANNAARPGAYTVTSIRMAIVRLGFRRVQELAMGAIVASLFRSKGEAGSYSRQSFWEHCVTTGIAARMIAERCPVETGVEWSFTAGVLHDIGILVLDQLLHDTFVIIQKDPELPNQSLEQIERIHLGFDHQDAGMGLLEKWGLPRTLIVAAGWHHRPSDAPDHHDAASLAYLAHNMASTLEMGYIESHTVDSGQIRFALQCLGLELEDARILLEDLPDEIHKCRSLFLVGGGL